MTAGEEDRGDYVVRGDLILLLSVSPNISSLACIKRICVNKKNAQVL